MSDAAHPEKAPVHLADAEGLVLRPSLELATIPARRQTASATPPAAGSEGSGAASLAEAWLLMLVAVLATLGWWLERRRRRRLETEKDSILWADVQPPASSVITSAGEAESVPGLPVPDIKASLSLPPVGESVSRREATLIDLHQLQARLRRRRERGDLVGAVEVLQQHLAGFRYTSPWVFLELRELDHLLAREQEWELAREAFRTRFAQKAPLWQAPSTADAQLADDPQIVNEMVEEWPYREARMVVLRWMMGEPEIGQLTYRPPILALGVYRDLLFLDRLLDDVAVVRPAPLDSWL
jgi:hypothetical protein